MMSFDGDKELIDAGEPPPHPYSRAVKTGGFIYVSGMLSQDADGALVAPGDVGAQTRLTLQRVGRVLEAAGSSLEHAVSVTVYLTSAADFEAMNAAYRTFWPKDAPTRTTVITGLVLPGALVEITTIAVPAGGERTVIHPPGWMKARSPYSYAIRSGDAVFVSGLVPRNGRDNKDVAGDIAVQTRVVMENAADVLSAAGVSLRDVVSSKVYLTDSAHFGAMNDVYGAHFRHEPPARATVRSGLAGSGFLVEMTFTASSAPRQAVGTPPGGLPLSPAIRAGGRLYVSGTLGNTPQTAGDAAAQTRETLARIRRTLEDAGASAADVVESLVYLTDAGFFPAMNEAYRGFFADGSFPARATVVTPLIASDALVEIMMTAVPGKR